MRALELHVLESPRRRDIPASPSSLFLPAFEPDDVVKQMKQRAKRMGTAKWRSQLEKWVRKTVRTRLKEADNVAELAQPGACDVDALDIADHSIGLDDELRARVKGELEPGERVLWAGRSIPPLLLRAWQATSSVPRRWPSCSSGRSISPIPSSVIPGAPRTTVRSPSGVSFASSAPSWHWGLSGASLTAGRRETAMQACPTL